MNLFKARGQVTFRLGQVKRRKGRPTTHDLFEVLITSPEKFGDDCLCDQSNETVYLSQTTLEHLVGKELD